MEEKEDYDDEGEEEEEEEEHDMRRYAIFAAERWKSPQMKKIPGPKKALNAVLPRSKSTYYLDESNWKVELNHPLLEAFQLKSDELFMFEGFMTGTTSMEITHPPPSKKKKPTKCGTLLKPKLTPLLQNSTPSSFGNGDETHHKRFVREEKSNIHIYQFLSMQMIFRKEKSNQLFSQVQMISNLCFPRWQFMNLEDIFKIIVIQQEVMTIKEHY